jgi:hypothetical protein
MVNAPLNGVLRHIRMLRETQALAEASDAQLLDRFAAAREEASFTALLKRHGPMVLGVSRRVFVGLRPRDQDPVHGYVPVSLAWRPGGRLVCPLCLALLVPAPYRRCDH